jgi:hypothetical protein
MNRQSVAQLSGSECPPVRRPTLLQTDKTDKKKNRNEQPEVRNEGIRSRGCSDCFSHFVKDPYESLKNWKGSTGKDHWRMPMHSEEIIHAAGFFPSLSREP